MTSAFLQRVFVECRVPPENQDDQRSLRHWALELVMGLQTPRTKSHAQTKERRGFWVVDPAVKNIQEDVFLERLSLKSDSVNVFTC